MARLLMISHVPPVPSTAGQRQRVRYTLEALGSAFEVTLLTTTTAIDGIEDQVAELCDEVITLDGSEPVSRARRLGQVAAGAVYAAATGLKRSNYDLARSFSIERVLDAVRPQDYDVMFMHYWHAHRATEPFRDCSVPVVLDMHDLLWRAREEQLRGQRAVPRWWIDRQVRKYRRAEQAAWRDFDALVAINAEEQQVAKESLGDDRPVWYVPMGLHLERWPAQFSPASTPARLAFYGGLSTPAREQAVLECHQRVMPLVWEHEPDVEFWIVGANPTDKIWALDDNDRVTVTGFVDDPGSLLATMTAVLCPFRGKFGFRSRLIEVMATGVPIVASPDAVAGMGLEVGSGVRLGDGPAELAEACVALLRSQEADREGSADAVHQASRFSFDETYGRLAGYLKTILDD